MRLTSPVQLPTITHESSGSRSEPHEAIAHESLNPWVWWARTCAGVGNQKESARHRSGLRARQRRHGANSALRARGPRETGLHGRRGGGRAARPDRRRARNCRSRSASWMRCASAACASSAPRATPPCWRPARASPSAFCSATTFPPPITPSAPRHAELEKAVEIFHPPIVVKADGLAAGKGVIICQSHRTAVEAAGGLFTGALLGAAERQVVIEEFLEGDEISFLCLSDGKHVAPLVPAQDHKRIGEGDTGPNTGGMGVYSTDCDARHGHDRVDSASHRPAYRRRHGGRRRRRLRACCIAA